VADKSLQSIGQAYARLSTTQEVKKEDKVKKVKKGKPKKQGGLMGYMVDAIREALKGFMNSEKVGQLKEQD